MELSSSHIPASILAGSFLQRKAFLQVAMNCSLSKKRQDKRYILELLF